MRSVLMSLKSKNNSSALQSEREWKTPASMPRPGTGRMPLIPAGQAEAQGLKFEVNLSYIMS